MDENWVERLDDVEQLGISAYRLDETFPRYFEFWRTYIDSGRYPELADIFKNHYTVFYHLIVALHQVNYINDAPLFDVASPFYHLGTVIDLTHRTFVEVLRITGNLPPELSEKSAFALKTREVETTFNTLICNKYETECSQFREMRRSIGKYRNMLTHDISPLKINDKGVIRIPKEDLLEKYRDVSWLQKPGETEIETEYVSAKELIDEFTRILVAGLNNLWEVLLRLMEEISRGRDMENAAAQLESSMDTLLGAATIAASGVVPFPGDEVELPPDLASLKSGSSESDEVPPYLRSSWTSEDDREVGNEPPSRD